MGMHPAPFSIKLGMNLSKLLSLVLPAQWEKHQMELLRIESLSLSSTSTRRGEFERELSPWVMVVFPPESETEDS